MGAWRLDSPSIEWLFAAVIIFALAVALRRAWQAWRAARREQLRAGALARTEPSEVARAAVREERRRLGEDITTTLRGSLRRIGAEAASALTAGDPRPAVERIRQQSQTATSDLRRQLGLLRDDRIESGGADPGPAARPVPTAGDLVPAAVAVVLATLESILYPYTEGAAPLPVSVALTVLAAACVVGRRLAPGAAALGMAAVYLAAIPLHAPIQSGFWTLFAVAPLVWSSCARQHATAFDRAAVVALGGAGALSGWLLDPDNLALWLLVLAVSATGGLLVGRATGRAASARHDAEQRQRELDAAAEAAVVAEQRTFARELHDVVSHAVGLIAVQAGAAEVCWPSKPSAARRSIAIIAKTADDTLGELERMHPVTENGARSLTVDDLDDLVRRIRLAGTPVEVELELAGEAGRELDPVAFRVMQEALTNVVRHAPGARARLSLRCGRGGETSIEVVDDGAATAANGRGYGLVGLAERVELAGGVLETGPGPDGHGFRVSALLPVRIEAAP